MAFPQMHRRSFLALGSSLIAFPQLLGAVARPRSISFHNLHTSEKLSTTYWADGQYIPESLAEINRIFRDHRNGDVLNIAPRLLDLLSELRLKLESSQPFELISGYRSPATNAMLRGQGHGVAENSLHTKGMAADIRIAGRSLALVRRAAISLKTGGVGYYPESRFVHVDIGRVRTW